MVNYLNYISLIVCIIKLFYLIDGLNASDFFEDNSFFSESILLSTQALEQEAVMAQCDSQSNVKYFNGVSRSPTPSKSKSKCEYKMDQFISHFFISPTHTIKM